MKKPCFVYWATSESFVGEINTFAEASKTAVAEERKWKRKEGTLVEYFYVACSRFLSCLHLLWLIFAAYFDWPCRESTSIKWLEFLSHLWPTWPTSYWTTRPFTILHLTGHTTLRKWSGNEELGKGEHVRWLLHVITRHIQDGALQVTREATSKCSWHIFTRNWTKRQLFSHYWGKVLII